MGNQGKTSENTGKKRESGENIEKHEKTGRIRVKQRKTRKTWKIRGTHLKTLVVGLQQR